MTTYAAYCNLARPYDKELEDKRIRHEEAVQMSRLRMKECKDEMLLVSFEETIQAVKVMRIAQKHTETAKKLNDEAKKEIRKQQREKNDEAKRGIKHIARRIDQNAAPPLKFVKRDAHCTDGGKVGTITTDPQQVDGVVRRAWQNIYQGNVEDAAATVAAFMKNMPATFTKQMKQTLRR